ncbi:MAG TPA: hypothetical protein VFZ65_01600 [Planctomycetota bacterium]|nr:hypothetical protein [Planctomycetota bacterium]
MAPFTPPPGYTRVQVVASFEALVATPFVNGTNAVCWPRSLPGDFDEVARHLADGDVHSPIDEARLAVLPVSDAGRAAIHVLLEDQRLLRSIGQAPTLECVREYARDDEQAPVPTDVYSFHVDSATVATDTYLCSYTEPTSEGLRHDEAVRCVDIPAIRARLLERFGGEPGVGFVAYLRQHCFDLHHAPLPGATPFAFGVGNLWRIAVQHPGSAVPACIHRAPATRPGRPPRLLLIS